MLFNDAKLNYVRLYEEVNFA